MVVAVHVSRPSSARMVRLDGFVPVPRGATQSVPAPLSWPAKDPGDVLDYQFDASPALIGDSGDSLVSLSVAIVPNGDASDLSLQGAALDGGVAVLWLSGGRPGFAYTVTLTLGTASGRTLVRSVVLPVLALSAPAGEAADLMIDAVNPFTDENGNPLLLGG